MELVYLWVEDYKNIKNQEFNFSPKFKCDYNPETNELTIDENKDNIENFFAKNINVTAIVGKNGSGKSSLLELIVIIFYYHKIFTKNTNANDEHRYILCFYFNNNYYYISGKNKNISVKGKQFQKFTQDINEILNILHFDNSINMIYPYNKVLWSFFGLDDPKTKFLNPHNEEYSEFFKLKPNKSLYIKEILEEENKNLIYKIFTKKRFDREYFTIDQIIIYIENKYTDDITDEDKEKACEYFNELINIRSKTIKEKLINLIFISYVINIEQYNEDNPIKNFDMHKIEKLKQDILSKDTIYPRNLTDKKDYAGYKKYLTKIKGSYYYKTEYEAVNYIKCIKKISDKDIEIIFNDLNDNIELAYLSTKHQHKKIKIVIENESLDYMIKKGFRDLLFLLPSNFKIDYKDTNRNIKYSNLSSGEKEILKIECYIKQLIDKSESKKFLILLDEPANSLHPEWQKKFIKYLIDTFKKRKDIYFHFVITTHSPFLISDIPSQNIIFLNTDENGNCKVVDGLKEKKETFGANIHTLLSDSFFMEDGLMGEFATSRINEIIEFHNIVSKGRHKEPLKKIYEKREMRFWQTQSVIGEEYLKQVIKNHLVEIEKILLGKDKAKEEEIKRVEKYLESLKND